jgi:hypothetical protein
MKPIHYPRLDTVLMVEDRIKNSKSYQNKRQLWLSLPNKIMYQTFNLILNYLQESGKILIAHNGRIIWTHNPKLMHKLIKVK